ncbi:MAG: hypothetical protein MUE95_06560 [Cyclobacteriaceae bacterium]|nr:hypothetical protein [Cyclobacteriaceae bacterium]
MIDIKAGMLFPKPFRLMGIIMAAGGFVLLPDYPWITLILLLAGILIVVSYEGTEINLQKKSYREYTALLLFRTGTFESFEEIEKIFINKRKETRQLYTAHTTHSSIYREEVYCGYLKFSNGTKILLHESTDKAALIKKLQPLCDAATVSITDNT